MIIIVCTECPHCKEEIQIKHPGEKILIGDEGKTNCPSCGKPIEYEIRVLTVKG